MTGKAKDGGAGSSMPIWHPSTDKWYISYHFRAEYDSQPPEFQQKSRIHRGSWEDSRQIPPKSISTGMTGITTSEKRTFIRKTGFAWSQ